MDPQTNTQQAGWPGGALETNPGTKPFAQPPAPPHANPNAVDHAQIGSQDKREGGKEMGLVHAPIVSLNPTSEKQGDANAKIGEHTIIDAAHVKLNEPDTGIAINWPFEEIDVGMGIFIPVEEGSTADALMVKVYKQIDQFRKQNSLVERDGNGDDVMVDEAINVKKRNDDGTVQLDGGVPRLTIKSGFVPKLLGPTFAAKAVVKGDKIGKNNEADGDGALVIRMS